MGTSLVWADPGWNPGLSEAEALAGPGRFLIGPQKCYVLPEKLATPVTLMILYLVKAIVFSMAGISSTGPSRPDLRNGISFQGFPGVPEAVMFVRQ